MPKELSDERLSAILEKTIDQSSYMADGKLSKERERVEKYYRGELPAPIHKGDSKYVSRDVFDSVDTMRSKVLEGFSAHTNIVNFRPEKGETDGQAKQATDYCRHVFFKKNDGEQIMYDTLSDALMKRFSVTKVFYEETTEEDEYEFEGLTPEELTMEVSQYDNYEFNETELSDNGLYSGSFTVETVKKHIGAEVVQPEDLMVSSRTGNLKDAKAIIHRVKKSKSDLLKEGYPEDKVEEITFGSDTDWDRDYEKQARFEAVDDIFLDDNEIDDSQKETVLHEVYLKLDMYKTGRNRLWKVCYAGGVVLSKEQIARHPFVSFVPLPIPHTFYGDNYAESVIPVQNARTVLIRQIINHTMITNNPRLQVMSGTVNNPTELLDNRLGGIVNVRRMDGIMPIPQAPLNPFVFNLIGMIDEDKEEVTGISKLSQGLNKDAISTQNAEGMVDNLISASEQRTKIIARQFGKYIKDLYWLIYHTALDHIDQDDYTLVTGDYVEVSPQDWRERSAATVELALGPAEAEMEAKKWVELDQYFRGDPQLQASYTPDKRWEVISRALEQRGIEDPEMVLTHPDKMKPQEPSEGEKLAMEEKKALIELNRINAQTAMKKAETDQIKAQNEQMKYQVEMMKAQREMQHQGFEQNLETKKFAHEVLIDNAEMEMARQVSDENRSANLSPNG